MVPNGWERKPLEKVAEIKTGVAKGKKGLKDPIEVPYLRVANVQDGYIDLSEVKTIQIERHQLERYSLQVGDVLMTEGGDFDKLGRGDVWQGQITPCLNQNHVFAVRPNQKVLLPYFLGALSGSNYGKTYFLSCAKRSTNLASINSTQLKEFPVLTPPLPEQRKIAKILSTWDKAIATTEKLIETSKQQKKALMQQLLTGKKRLVNPETGEAFDGKWEEVTLSSIAKQGKGNFTDGDWIESPYIAESGCRLIQTGNIGVGCFKNKNRKFISETSFIELKCNEVKVNDLLICRLAEPAGRACVVPDIGEAKMLTSVDVTIMRVDGAKSSPKYLSYYFSLDHTLYTVSTLCGGSTRSRVSRTNLGKMNLLLPSIGEQQQIASVLTIADKEIGALEAKLAHFKQEKKALMQQLLTGKRRVHVE
ncbi:restriction endonuclease subunit S [Vibrio pomeroyi]|uniref:restriction endonuclease subunit S n=1 Tax=Vibrio pomeroyi TaxID=198832 RepID=UPI0035A6BC4C